jgi:hypothetical protein
MNWNSRFFYDAVQTGKYLQTVLPQFSAIPSLTASSSETYVNTHQNTRCQYSSEGSPHFSPPVERLSKTAIHLTLFHHSSVVITDFVFQFINFVEVLRVFIKCVLLSGNTLLPPRRPGFDPGSVHVGFVVDKEALGQVFPRVLRFSPVSVIPPVLHYLEKWKNTYHRSLHLHHRVAQ